MYYSLQMAQRLVIKAGLELLRQKLIVRTWGNISARISENEFVITPSGRAYEKLTPEDLVVVKVNDLSYEGNIKPSAEKGIHAGIYALYPDVNFVIHTHQFYASAISAQLEDTEFAPCAAYALSGTKELSDAVIASAKANPDKKSILMARHGALVFGENYEYAMQEASELEEKCEKLFREKKVIPDKVTAKKFWMDDYAQIMGPGRKASDDEDPEVIKLLDEKNFAAASYVNGAKPLPLFEVILQNVYYRTKYAKLKKAKH